jgi:hypothetical protein
MGCGDRDVLSRWVLATSALDRVWVRDVLKAGTRERSLL